MFKGKKNQWLEVYGKTLVIRTPRPGQQEKPSLKLGFPRTTSQLYGELYGDPWRLTPSVCGNLGLLDHQSLLIHCSWAMGRPCCRNEAFDSSVSELWDSGILQSARFPQHHMFPEASRADLSNARARSLWAGSVSSILQGIYLNSLLKSHWSENKEMEKACTQNTKKKTKLPLPSK